jgi:hypothetical protein
MHTTSLHQKLGIIVVGCDGVNFVALGQQSFNKIHPEVIDIPGGVEYDSDSHAQQPTFFSLDKTEVFIYNPENEGFQGYIQQRYEKVTVSIGEHALSLPPDGKF